MIQLGLRRAAQLFRDNPQPWRAVHVAGTNGKGTVCTFLSSFLTASKIKCGRFTSPHLIHRWDCITIDGRVISEAVFRAAEADVLRRNENEKIGATEFEILTATAFDIFTREQVEIGVVEVGMGGRDDATNVLKSKALTILTPVALDHQKYLGGTIQEIARHKCGIFAKGVPILIDAWNERAVFEIAREEASRIGAGPLRVGVKTIPRLGLGPRLRRFAAPTTPMRAQLGTAFEAFRLLYATVLRPDQADDLDMAKIAKPARAAILGARRAHAGRMQKLNLRTLFPARKNELEKVPVWIDGAHNLHAAKVLDNFVLPVLRNLNDLHCVTWVIAATQGRDLAAFLKTLVNKGDNVAAVEFGPVDGMPWTKALAANEVGSAAKAAQPDVGEVVEFGRDLRRALEWAVFEKGKPVMIAGSLYLAADMYRLLIDAHRGPKPFNFAGVHLVPLISRHKQKVR